MDDCAACQSIIIIKPYIISVIHIQIKDKMSNYFKSRTLCHSKNN